MAGFIMLDRNLQDSYVFQNDRNWWMWCKLKYLEKFEDGEVRLGKSRNKIAYKKGQIAILLKDLCRELRITHKPLHEYLQTLEDEGLIKVDIQPKYTIITFIYFNETSHQNVSKSKHKSENSKSKVESSPIIKEVEEIEKTKNKNTLNFSREVEFEYFEQLNSSEEFFKETAAIFGSDVQTLKKFLESFKSECLVLEKRHKDFADFRLHFFSWVKKELNRGPRPQIKTDEKETTNKRAARRGTDVGNHSAEDFGGSF